MVRITAGPPLVLKNNACQLFGDRLSRDGQVGFQIKTNKQKTRNSLTFNVRQHMIKSLKPLLTFLNNIIFRWLATYAN